MNNKLLSNYEISEITRIAKSAAKKAQDENHRLGLPNIYELNKHIIFMYPDGRIESKIMVEYQHNDINK